MNSVSGLAEHVRGQRREYRVVAVQLQSAQRDDADAAAGDARARGARDGTFRPCDEASSRSSSGCRCARRSSAPCRRRCRPDRPSAVRLLRRADLPAESVLKCRRRADGPLRVRARRSRSACVSVMSPCARRRRSAAACVWFEAPRCARIRVLLLDHLDLARVIVPARPVYGARSTTALRSTGHCNRCRTMRCPSGRRARSGSGSTASRCFVRVCERVDQRDHLAWRRSTGARLRSRHCAILKVGRRALVNLRIAPSNSSSGRVADADAAVQALLGADLDARAGGRE